jgi:uncharacterized protein YkwD
MVNHIRAHHGMRRLRLDAKVSSYAWHHSLRMARQRRLFHSTDLRSHLGRWDPSAWGENVGFAPTVRGVVRAWMNSAPHRDNLLRRRYRWTGIGVVRTGGLFWITMDLWD